MSRIVRLAPLCAALALSACTLNVASFRRDVTDESEPGAFTRLRADLPTAGAAVAGSEITVVGAARTNAAATVTVAGLLGSDGDPEAVVRGLHVEWLTAGDPVRELRVAYDGPTPETVWVERVAIELPVGTEVELSSHDASVEVTGLDASVHVDSEGGAIRVRDAREVALDAASGSIDVVADHGVLSSSSGSIEMTLAGEVDAFAGSGSITGSFGNGGTITTRSGAIDVTLTTALDRDLTLSTSGGPVRLVVPAGTAAQLELTAASGGVHVAAGGVSHDGDDFHGAIGGGGPFTVRLHSDSGSVTLTEQTGP